MKRILFLVSMCFLLSQEANAYQVSFQDFMDALGSYKKTRSIDDKVAALNLYEMLSQQDQSRASQELKKAQISETSQIRHDELWNRFTQQYTQWNDLIESQGWHTMNYEVYTQQNRIIFNQLLEEYARLDESQKASAINLIQGALHQYPVGSVQFQLADNELVTFHQKQIEQTKDLIKTMQNFQEDRKKKVRQFAHLESDYPKLVQENKSLKEEIPSLQNELIDLTQKLASVGSLGQQQEKAQAIEQENKDLSQQLVALRAEITQLEQQLKQKAQKRKK